MKELLKTAGIAGGAALMILCCVAPFVVLGAIGWLWAWLGGLDPVLAASVALLVAVLAYGLIHGGKRGAGALRRRRIPTSRRRRWTSEDGSTT